MPFNCTEDKDDFWEVERCTDEELKQISAKTLIDCTDEELLQVLQRRKEFYEQFDYDEYYGSVEKAFDFFRAHQRKYRPQ